MKSSFSFLCLIVLLLGGCASGHYGGAGAALPLEQAQRLYNRSPHSPAAGLAYARALRTNGAPEKAQATLRPFAHEDGVAADLLIELAVIQQDLGQREEAEKYARLAAEKEPENHQAYYVLGVMLEKRENYEEAEEAYEKSLELAPSRAPYIVNRLALCQAALEKFAEASALLQEASKADPSNIEIERNLRITQALTQSYTHTAPKPDMKPDKAP